MPQVIVTAIIAGGGAILTHGASLLVALKVAGVAVGVQLLGKLFGPQVGTQRDARGTITAAVAPARWILGRARVGGAMVFYSEVEGEERTNEDGVSSDVHLALVLSEGPCDSLERVWVDGEEVVLQRTARTGNGESGYLHEPVSRSPYKDRLSIYEYFDADGVGGDSLRAATSEWTTDNRLRGLSWVHVHMRQPAYGNEVESRFWVRLPQLEYLVKGLKFTWPGQAVETWTENAAAIRWWWLRERRGIPEEMIDEASVTAALAVCSEVVTVTIPAGSDYEGYEPKSARYSSNGVVHADDDPQRVENELDFSWQGYSVEADGVHFFNPGADRAPIADIEPDDILEGVSIQTAAALPDRVNAITTSLAQSSAHDWTPLALPDFEDTQAQARDGERLPRDLGTRAFVTDPVAAARLLATQLRRARASASFTYRLRAGLAMEWLELKPTDRVTITDTENGLSKFRAMVARTQLHRDWSITVTLVEQPVGINADTLRLPPLKPRGIVIGETDIPVPANVRARVGSTIQDGGGRINHIEWSWDPVAVAETQIAWKGGDSEYVFRLTRGRRKPPSTPGSVNTADYVPPNWNDDSQTPRRGKPVQWYTRRQKGDDDVWGPWDTPAIYSQLAGGVEIFIVDDVSSLDAQDEFVIFSAAGKRARLLGVSEKERYRYKLRHVDSNGTTGVWTKSKSIRVDGDLDAPSEPEDVIVVGEYGAYEVAWADPPEKDYRRTEIRHVDVGKSADSTDKRRFRRSPPLRRHVPDSPKALTVYLRHEDRAGNASAWVSANVETLGNPVINTRLIFIRSVDEPPEPDNTPVGEIPEGWSRRPGRTGDTVWASLGERKRVGSRPGFGDDEDESDISDYVVEWDWGPPFEYAGDGPEGPPGRDGIAGKPGFNGIDGEGIEFIFQAAVRKPARPPAGGTAVDDYVPPGWFDNPVDATPDVPKVWVCTRKGKTGNWRAWRGVRLWTRFGDDGAGYEQIFRKTASDIPPATPTGQNRDEYVPLNWNANAVSPGLSRQWVWVSVRRKPGGPGMPWDPFQAPVLYTKYGIDGDGIEYIFRRTRDNVRPATPASVQVDEDVPTGWTDDETGTDETWITEWACSRKYRGKTERWSDWRNPKRIRRYAADGERGAAGPAGVAGTRGFSGVDGEGVEFVFRAATTRPSRPTGGNGTDDFVPTGWLDDPPDPTGAVPKVWVCKRKGTTGNWGNWRAVRLWTRFGEDGSDGTPGTDGDDGSGVEQVFRRANSSSAPGTPVGTNVDGNVPGGWSANALSPSLSQRWVWVSTRTKGAGRNAAWRPFKAPVIYTIYGRDGNGIEFIFKRTRDNTRPARPASGQTDGAVPSGWSNDLQGVDSTWVREWVCRRRYTRSNEQWGTWSNPKRLTRYAADGERGADGQRGQQGDAGPAGPASTVAGPRGPAGGDGPRGGRGATGTTGATGPRGATGAQGPAGSAGTHSHSFGDITGLVTLRTRVNQTRNAIITGSNSIQRRLTRLENAVAGVITGTNYSIS